MIRLILALAALAFATSAVSADDIMASRYGNTTIATNSKGVVTKIYYKADNTFTGKQGPLNFAGTWKLNATSQLCLTFATTVPGLANPTCVPASAHKVGDTWGGAGQSVTLVQGIQ